MVFRNRVVFITVHDQKALAIDRGMDDRITDFDIPKDMLVVFPHIFIMIPWDIDDLGVMTRLSENLLDDGVMVPRPIDPF